MNFMEFRLEEPKSREETLEAENKALKARLAVFEAEEAKKKEWAEEQERREKAIRDVEIALIKKNREFEKLTPREREHSVLDCKMDGGHHMKGLRYCNSNDNCPYICSVCGYESWH